MPLSATSPELAALDLFVSVVELGSLSKAAEAHGISQPSASSRIRGLERRLGLTLLDRAASGSTPTSAGSLVAGWSASVIQSTNELNAGVEALKARTAGRLRVAASLTIAEHLLPPWLEKFLRNRPSDSVKLEVANSATVVRRLADNRADLGFIESPTIALSTADDEGHLKEQVVALDALIVVVAPTHPWTQRSTIAVEELAATPLVLREQGSGTRDALEAALVDLGHGTPTSALELGSTAAVCSAVVSGHSPTVISERAVAADLTAGSLVQVDVDGLNIERKLRAVWRSERPRHDVADALLAMLPNVSPT